MGRATFRLTAWVLAVGLGAAGVVGAAEWPQFLGPSRDATSPEKGLMRSWPEGGPKVLWTVRTGPGYGGAAVRDGQVYMMDRERGRTDILRVFDLATGKELWKFGYPAPGRISHPGSRSTPAVGERLVVIVGPKGHVHCLDRATHRVVWKKHLLEDYGTKGPTWAVTQSALIYKDMVILAPQSRRVGITALDLATGRVRWESPPVGPMDYASPMLRTVGGVEQVTIVNREGVSAVDAATGRLLWRYRHPCRILVPPKGAGGFEVTELARIEKVGSHIHPAFFHGGYLYALCNTNERKDGLVCFDLRCRIVWQTGRSPNLSKGGSILTADGLIYQMDGATGELHIVEPSPKGFRSLDKVKLLGGREIWGPLALSDGYLIVRDQMQMKCLDIKPGR